MRRILNYFGVLAIASLLFLSCSPTARLNRLVAKNPELLKERIDTVYIPSVEVDTFFTLKYDTVEVYSGIDSIFMSIPDCAGCTIATKEIVKYIESQKQITDTLVFVDQVANDTVDITLIVKVWQEGREIRLNALIKESKIITKTEYVVAEPPKKRLGILEIAILITVAIAMLYFIITKV